MSPIPGFQYAQYSNQKESLQSINDDLKWMKEHPNIFSKMSYLSTIAWKCETYFDHCATNPNASNPTDNFHLASAMLRMAEEAMNHLAAEFRRYVYNDAVELYQIDHLRAVRQSEADGMGSKSHFLNLAAYGHVKQNMVEVEHEARTLEDRLSAFTNADKQNLMDHMCWALIQAATNLSQRYFGWEIEILGHVVPATRGTSTEMRPTIELAVTDDRTAVRKAWDKVKGLKDRWSRRFKRKGEH